MKRVIVLGMREKCPEGYVRVDTTSRSKNWSKGLSPFFLGKGVELYGDFKAENILKLKT